MYKLKNVEHDNYLQVQTEGIKGSSSPTYWRIMQANEEGAVTIQDAESDLYLRCGNDGEVNAVTYSNGW